MSRNIHTLMSYIMHDSVCMCAWMCVSVCTLSRCVSCEVVYFLARLLLILLTTFSVCVRENICILSPVSTAGAVSRDHRLFKELQAFQDPLKKKKEFQNRKLLIFKFMRSKVHSFINLGNWKNVWHSIASFGIVLYGYAYNIAQYSAVQYSVA